MFRHFTINRDCKFYSKSNVFMVNREKVILRIRVDGEYKISLKFYSESNVFMVE